MEHVHTVTHHKDEFESYPLKLQQGQGGAAASKKQPVSPLTTNEATGGEIHQELTPEEMARMESRQGGKSKAEEVEQKQPDISSSTAALRVIDVTGAPILDIHGSDVGEQNCGWLRSKVVEHLNSTKLQSGDIDPSTVHLYQFYGDWLEDNVPLVKLQGNRVYFKRYQPHGSAFQINLKLLPKVENERVITISVTDSDTIKTVKDKIATEHKISKMHQRILFAGRALDDNKTLADYKIPAEATFELDVVSV